MVSNKSFVAAAYNPAKAGKELPCCHCGKLMVCDQAEWYDRERDDNPVCESCAQAWHTSRSEKSRDAGALLPQMQRMVRQREGACLLFINIDRSYNGAGLVAYLVAARPSISNKRHTKRVPSYADMQVVAICLLDMKKLGEYERKALPTADMTKWARGLLISELGAKLDVPCAMMGGGTLGLSPTQAGDLMSAILMQSAKDLIRQTAEREAARAGGVK